MPGTINDRDKRFRRGDTLVEVMFAVGIFGTIAISAIGLMNNGLSNAQTALEVTMARNEINGQAEALRFIRDAYSSDYNISGTSDYKGVWNRITSLAISAKDIDSAVPTASYPRFTTYPSGITSCAVDSHTPNTSAYQTGTGIIRGKSFVINTHAAPLSSSAQSVYTFSEDTSTSVVRSASTYPRLIYSDNAEMGSTAYETDLTAAEGIWITAVASEATGTRFDKPQYYDFYIRTCWDIPGRGIPMLVSTTIRLYNPDAR